jgi:hypothetical protein
MGIISDYFRNRAEKRNQDRIAEDKSESILKAIDNANPAVVKHEFDSAEKADINLNKYHKNFLYQAIKKNDTETFAAVFESVGADDYTFTERWGMAGSGFYTYSERSILSMAIACDSENVALYLAERPSIDIEDAGHSEDTMYHSGGLFSSSSVSKKRDDYDEPLVAARKKDMKAVIAVLAQRKSHILETKARSLAAEANKLAQ